MALYIKFKKEYASFDIDTIIKEEIEMNSVRTWRYEGNRFTHKPRQWERNVWLENTESGEDWVKYDVFPGDVDPMTSMEYAIACGRFVEMVISHYSENIEDIKVEPFLE